jgi:hypothetical protein
MKHGLSSQGVISLEKGAPPTQLWTDLVKNWPSAVFSTLSRASATPDGFYVTTGYPSSWAHNLGLVHRVSFAVMAVAGLGSELKRLN